MMVSSLQHLLSLHLLKLTHFETDLGVVRFSGICPDQHLLVQSAVYVVDVLHLLPSHLKNILRPEALLTAAEGCLVGLSEWWAIL